ncbi:MAG TPA: energy transducer TonB [Bryobacteraceae bacterium]
MFEQSMLLGTGRTGRPWTVPVSFAGQAGVVGLLVLAPLIFTERLKVPPLDLSAPIRLGVRKPPTEHSVKLVSTGQAARQAGKFTAPSRIPHGTPAFVDAPQIARSAESAPGCEGVFCIAGDPNGMPIGALSGNSAVALPPPPHAKPAAAAPKAQPGPPPRIKIGGLVQDAKLLARVKPEYPRLALIARISGPVEMGAVIGVDGRIRELTVLSGHPMLVPAAIEAVRQWVYSPTLLNGVPVEVSTWVKVVFTLGAL